MKKDSSTECWNEVGNEEWVDKAQNSKINNGRRNLYDNAKENYIG
jgi:hypothetical protein